jgi:hypothetical protein
MRALILFGIALAAIGQSGDEETREIWDLGFRAKRPTAPAAVPHDLPKAPTYHRVVPIAPAGPQASTLTSQVAPAAPVPTAISRQVVGITLWHLRLTERTDDSGARLLMQDPLSAKPREYVPIRIPLDQPLRVGDQVRLGFEFPREGFLYVVDRERYKDGSCGEPYLIFPVLNLNHGDNRVLPGRLIEIPSQADALKALTVHRQNERHVGEELLILFSPEHLASVTAGQPDSALPRKVVEGWERDWSVSSSRLDLADSGEAWTVVEKAAGAEQRLLTQADPMPQSLVVASVAADRPFLLHVSLEVR